jgi:uncharacterized protein (TIGR02145 family)
MQTKHLFLLLTFVFFACTNLQAQVTIGGLTAPTAGAILDLNSPGGARGGFVLSNVNLQDLTTIPFEGPGAFSGTPFNMANVKAQFKGAMVYHRGENGILAGIYVWTGTQWIPTGTNILYDAQGNDYTIGYFGAAGTWMTQNLRTTQDSDGTPLEEGHSDDKDAKRYDYPGPSTLHNDMAGRKAALEANDNKLLETYGLFYSWAAASGRTDDTGDSDGTPGYGDKPSRPDNYHQGVCPTGWHLPSDWEWSELEKAIALYPWGYSSQTVGEHAFADYYYTYDNVYRPSPGGTDEKYWGRQMKSTTTVPDSETPASYSSSNSREAGGFDALLVGYVNAVGANEYGSRATFWSSSSSNDFSICRVLNDNYTGVLRDCRADRKNLYSVRCKKD